MHGYARVEVVVGAALRRLVDDNVLPIAIPCGRRAEGERIGVFVDGKDGVRAAPTVRVRVGLESITSDIALQPGYDKMRDIQWRSTPEQAGGDSRCPHPCLPGTQALDRR